MHERKIEISPSVLGALRRFKPMPVLVRTYSVPLRAPLDRYLVIM